jgi:hypothetical protein
MGKKNYQHKTPPGSPERRPRRKKAERPPLPIPKRPAHRPSEYDDALCDIIIEYFQDKIETQSQTQKGEKWYPPTLEGFAASIGVATDTLREWATRHPRFSVALKTARGMFADMVVSRAMVGEFAQPMSIFALKNICKYRDNPPDEENESQSQKERDEYSEWRIERRLFDRQKAVYSSAAKKKVLVCGRRSGKTEELISEAIRSALHDGRVLYVGLTAQKAKSTVWQKIIDVCAGAGIECIPHHTEYRICVRGGEIVLAGNGSADEREKLRGASYDLVIVDETQSQKELRYLLEDVIEPTLMDRRGTLILAGTPPRVRGTYYESMWEMEAPHVFKSHWDIRDNPHIPEPDVQLERIRQEHGWMESDPTYQREYLGVFAYDDQALVFRPSEKNYYVNSEFDAWLEEQDRAEVRCIIGADIGYVDADALAVICFVPSSNKKWLIHEYVARRTGVEQFRQAAQHAIDIASQYTNHGVRVYYDSGGGGRKICEDFYTVYRMPFYPAEKMGKPATIEAVQEDIVSGAMRIHAGGEFDSDSKYIVYSRDEKDILTREIDDAYHSDIMDAVLYAHRFVMYDQRGGE